MVGSSQAQLLDYSRIASRDWPARFGAQFCVISLICISIAAPPVTIIPGTLWLRPEELLLPVVGVIYLWFLLAGYARPIRVNGMFLVGLLFCATTLLSAWYGAEALHHTVILRDFYDLPRALFPVAFFTLGYEAELSEKALRRLLSFFGVTVLLVCLYAWAQWMNLGFTQVLNTYYSALNHDSALYYARRVYATLGNPNHLAQLMSWCVVAFVLAVLFRVGNQVRNIALALASLVTLVMTGSRYGLVLGALGLALIFALALASRRIRGWRLASLPAALVVFGLTFAIVSSSNQGTLERFRTLENPMQIDSFRGRLDRLWVQPLADFLQSPILGHGPAKSIYTDVITDSEDLDVLKKFGLQGFFIYLAYFLLPLALAWKGLKAARRGAPFLEERSPATFLTLRLSFIMCLQALAMNIFMSTFQNLSLQAFLWLWLGLGACAARTIRDGVYNASFVSEPGSQVLAPGL